MWLGRSYNIFAGDMIPQAPGNTKGVNMIQVTLDVANAPHCVNCRRRILSAFVDVPAVRAGTKVLYTTPAHVDCFDLAHSELIGDALTTAQTVQEAMLDGLEAQVRRWQAVTP